MLNRISQLYSEWQSLQPLKPYDQKRLDEKFRLEFNYNSNHIEGNTLTYGQTKLLLIFERTEGVHELREYEEMKAHDVALKMIIAEAKDKERPLTENFIRTLNETILVRSFWKDAQTQDGQNTRMEVKVGEYKSRPNHVRTASNDIFHYATVEETPAMMKELVEWYNLEVGKDELSPIELAALLHYRYIRIHPFEDGNGRIARLLVNYILFRYDYPMVIIQTKDKNNYLRTLNRCDVEVGLEPMQGANADLGKIQPFVAYLGEQLVHSFEIAIKAAKGESIEEEDDFEKKLSLLERKLKVSEIEKPSYKPEYVWDIIDNFYLPYTKLFIEKLSPLNTFFETSNTTGFLDSKKFDISKVLIRKEFESTKISGSKTVNNIINSTLVKFEDFRKPKSLKFDFELKNPKNIKLEGIKFKYILSIQFCKDTYLITSLEDTFEFNYKIFPETIAYNTLIENFKKIILSTIESAVK
jgi:Fic family protein